MRIPDLLGLDGESSCFGCRREFFHLGRRFWRLEVADSLSAESRQRAPVDESSCDPDKRKPQVNSDNLNIRSSFGEAVSLK